VSDRDAYGDLPSLDKDLSAPVIDFAAALHRASR
jgi:hypothetical protein